MSRRDIPGANAPGNPVANCDTDPDLPRRGNPTGVTRCAGRPQGESISGPKKKRPDESGQVLFEVVCYSEFSEASASVRIVSNAF